MLRRYGDPIGSGRKYTLRRGAYAIVARGREVLLTHQAEPIPEFQLPGGGIDPGESMLTALHREVLEETGWRIAAPRRLGVFRRFTYMPEYDLWAEKLCHVFLARPVRRVMDPTEPGHTEMWAPAEVAAEIVGNEGDQAFVRDYFGLV